MNDLIGRVFDFEKRVFPSQNDLYARLVADGQSPKALMISCADSRVVPEQIMQAAPGDLFVCRNAGNIVPPYATQNGGVTSTVEYAVMVLGIRDIIVCGHSDCGAMKAVENPDRSRQDAERRRLAAPQSSAAAQVVEDGYPEMDKDDRDPRDQPRERRRAAQPSAHAPISRGRHSARRDFAARLVRRYQRGPSARPRTARPAASSRFIAIVRCPSPRPRRNALPWRRRCWRPPNDSRRCRAPNRRAVPCSRLYRLDRRLSSSRCRCAWASRSRLACRPKRA